MPTTSHTTRWPSHHLIYHSQKPHAAHKLHFIYELDKYTLKMYLMTKNELSTSRLLKLIVLHTDRHKHVQTDGTERITTPLCMSLDGSTSKMPTAQLLVQQKTTLKLENSK